MQKSSKASINWRVLFGPPISFFVLPEAVYTKSPYFRSPDAKDLGAVFWILAPLLFGVPILIF